MKGDFSRIPFDPRENISRVLFQQGRPLVEADINEALMVLLKTQREIIRRTRSDASEHHGAIGNAFKIGVFAEMLTVGEGDYRFEDIFVTNPPN